MLLRYRFGGDASTLGGFEIKRRTSGFSDWQLRILGAKHSVSSVQVAAGKEH